jgi:hypothetical protein
MLDLSDEARLIDDMWTAADVTLQLSDAQEEEFFEPTGPLSRYFDDRRSFHRFYLRSRAILKRGDSTLGVYTVDFSRQGIGFLSPRQLLPKEQVQLLLPNGMDYEFCVARCRRLRPGCYACGGIFTAMPAQRSATQ